MDWLLRRLRKGRRVAAIGVLSALFASTARAQGPQVDIDNPPGASEARGSLGPSLGASGTSGFDVLNIGQQPSLFGGRPGASTTHAPLNQLGAPPSSTMQPKARFKPVVLEAAPIPTYGDLGEPKQEEDEGPANGMTLDMAIELLIRQNLNLTALRFEIPMAEADVLTAGLRNNPIFYADGQLVPYGHFSTARPGGQTQYDVNLTWPLDVWRKRRAKMLVYESAKRVTEAQFQDAVRLQIDNLYTAYIDVVAARETLRYSKAYTTGIGEVLRLVTQLFNSGQRTESDVDTFKAQLEQAQLQVHESTQTLNKSKRTLGLLLNLPKQEADAIQPRSRLGDFRPLPLPEEELVRSGLASRPDLNANRLGIARAQADVRLAHSNRFSDVYLLYQPYTYQFNGPFGLKNAYSYAVGVTVAAPIFNRNQGNIARSKLNVTQTQVEVANQERQVVYDVEEAVREFTLSLQSQIELNNEVVPASRRVRNAALLRFKGGEVTAIDYLDAQKEYNEVVRRYRDALVRHRRAMLDLNTAVGVRILP